MNGPIVKDDKIKPGDVVQLKSGGPPMTVAATCGEGDDITADVVRWTNDKGFAIEESVPVVMLKKVEPAADGLRAAAEAVYASLVADGEVSREKVEVLGCALGKAVV